MLNHKTTLREEPGAENLQKKKSPVAKTRRSSRAEQVSFSPHLRTTKTQNRTSTTGQGREREFSGKSPSPARSALPAPSKSHRGTKETPRLSTDKVEREKSTPNKRPDEIRWNVRHNQHGKQRQKYSLTSPTVRTARTRAKQSNEPKPGSSPQRMMATLATGGTTTFRSVRLVFAATITKKCRCRLCRTHHSAGRLTAEQLIKGGKHYVPPFRKPATAAPTKALREWVAALFWCSHREERETWETLRIREREYMNSIPQFTTMVSGRSSQISSAGRGQSNFRAVPDGSTKLAYETIEHDEGSKVRSTPGTNHNSGSVKKHSTTAAGASSEQEILRRIESLAVNPAAWFSDAEQDARTSWRPRTSWRQKPGFTKKES